LQDRFDKKKPISVQSLEHQSFFYSKIDYGKLEEGFNDVEKDLHSRKIRYSAITQSFFKKRTLEELNFRSYLVREER